ncbi:MAG TPA: hypothetical protein VK681_39135 [Reyranella sp.]|nr:hypothetical protein [Reyranella sp.]
MSDLSADSPSAPTPGSAEPWVIYKPREEIFWRAEGIGYTGQLLNAGLYTEQQAKAQIADFTSERDDLAMPLSEAMRVIATGIPDDGTVRGHLAASESATVERLARMAPEEMVDLIREACLAAENSACSYERGNLWASKESDRDKETLQAQILAAFAAKDAAFAAVARERDEARADAIRETWLTAATKGCPQCGPGFPGWTDGGDEQLQCEACGRQQWAEAAAHFTKVHANLADTFPEAPAHADA